MLAPFVSDVALLVEHEIPGPGCPDQLGAVRFCDAADVPREFDGGDLHAEAKAEIRHIVSRAKRVAWILPSTPRSPNPPGINTPATSLS
jgi:hypothetical protein